MSYTKFTIENIATNKQSYSEDDIIEVTCNVNNIGKMQGGEVVQAYVGFENAKVERPVKVLKAFSKVYLNPDQSQNVKLQIPVKDLAYWDVESQSWKVEKIQYSIYVILLKQKIYGKYK